MPTPDDTARIHAAITHATHHRLDAGMTELAHVTRTNDDTYRLWQTLTEHALGPIRRQAPGGPRWGLAVFERYAGTDIDDADPHVRLALRFVMAQGPRDEDAQRALFDAAVAAGGREVMDGVLRLLLEAAGKCARAQQTGPGAFGGGR